MVLHEQEANMIRAIIFIAISAGITLFSFRWLGDRHAHGFYRYFAFEFILALILVNSPYWFLDPFSTLQIVSWLALGISIALVLHGVYLLKVIGRPSGDIENTTRLVHLGIYRYIRHPLYSSLLWFTCGALLKQISVLTALLAFGATLSLVLTARAEEAENLAKFGTEYADYMNETKRFIPLFF